MNFSDQGLIINIKKYGENDAIVKIFSQKHGICRGYVKKINSKKQRSLFQIGNLISFEWKSRVEDGLGSFYYVDLIKNYFSKILFEKIKLNSVSTLFFIIDNYFYERENHNLFYQDLESFLNFISYESENNNILKYYIILELKVLEIMGYGLDLSCCAASGVVDDLAYVSPKSAKAVSQDAAEPYKDKLLKLPKFILDNFNNINLENKNITFEDIKNGFKLSGYFLEKFVFSQKNHNISSRRLILDI